MSRGSDEEGCSSETPRDRRNRRRYTLLLAGWAVVYLLSSFLITNTTLEPDSVSWIVALLPSIVAAFAAFAYWRYLREADELARSIEVKALALAVTVGFVVWPAVELLEASGVPLKVGSSLTALIMIVSYSAGVVAARRHYR